MSATRNGRRVYCVITDKYGNAVTSETVTLSMEYQLMITKQPTSVIVEKGKTAKVTLEVMGDGLTYQWYYANPGSDEFKLTTSFTGNTYSVNMNDARNGRRVYCVITDQYGNQVVSEVITLGMT